MRDCVVWRQRIRKEVPCCKQDMQHCESCKVPERFGYFHNGKRFVRKFVLREEFEALRNWTEKTIIEMREELDRQEEMVK